ncbi:MAG: glycosyltransferase [Vicinamibacterales bacterium]
MIERSWRQEAEAIFAARPEVASVSVVPERFIREAAPLWRAPWPRALQATVAAWPACVFNPRVADLIGATEQDDQSPSESRVGVLAAAATLKGLSHAWLIVSDDEWSQRNPHAVPAPVGDRVVIAPLGLGAAAPPPLSIGIDASWLLGGESGAQVFVYEMLREMAGRAEIGDIVLLSDAGDIPPALAGTGKITGMTWPAALSNATRLDILHRPYQPGETTDLDRYRSIADAVAITVLDFIAYDNPSYHESSFAWRQYQRAFDEKIRDADQVFAISRHVGERLQRQFAHRLSAPVRSIHLGADHLTAASIDSGAAPELPPELRSIGDRKFLLVLGNDFAHKNRDFAVRVFRDLCTSGYEGALVMAGFHLDAGSSYETELHGAGPYAERVLRSGRLTSAQKAWLMRRAQVVLYPTSSEGFGLIPFEAAVLGTPTAFVKFGPLAETMPRVAACDSWNVRAFSDHVSQLMSDPATYVAQVLTAAESMTWARTVDQMIEALLSLRGDQAPWQSARSMADGPPAVTRLNESLEEYARRARGKLRRLINR